MEYRESGVDPESYRDALGRFATGVTVVTVPEGDGIAGFTANAFSALSLAPPLVLVCPSYRSRTYASLRIIGRFSVNLLAEGQADLARCFSNSGAPEVPRDAWRLGESGLPLLDGALAQIACRYQCEYQGGDHAIVIGKVESIAIPAGEPKPLLCFRGALGVAQFTQSRPSSAGAPPQTNPR